MKDLKIILEHCKKLVLISIILLQQQEAYATHAAGADFTYRCLGGLQYELNLTFYRDCGGVAEPNTINISYRTKTGSYTTPITVTATKNLSSGQEITSPCATATTKCNGGTYTGIRQWRYSAIVTLPGAAIDWVFSYQICCRNCVITTINTPCSSGISNLYVEATLNNLDATCNNSPTFSSVPIAFVYVGQNFNYNHGVLDADGDSLVYSLITPRFNSTTDVTFIPPHNTANPIISSTPFTINPRTGDIKFTPSQTEVGILTVLVQEYRNQKLIGSVLRDMQVYTSISSNSLPTASGMNGNNNFVITSCANTPICFDIYTNDADSNQNVSISTNNGIPGASYTFVPGKRPRLNFCWTPPFNTLNTTINTFTVTVKDDACGLNGVQIFSYTIYVPPPYFNVSATNNDCFGSNEGTASVIPLSGGPYAYLWSNGATTQNVNGLLAGTYNVTVSDAGSGCAVTTAVTVSQPPDIVLSTVLTNASCLNVCNGAINLSASGSSGYSYMWSNGEAAEDISGICPGTYDVTVTDATGCTKSGSYSLQANYAVTTNTTSTAVSCKGNSTGNISLTASNGVGPYSYLWNNSSVTQNLNNIIAGSYSVTVTDQNGCTANAIAEIFEPAASLTLSTSATDISCQGLNNGSLTALAAGGTTPYIYSWSNGGTTSTVNNLPPGTFNITVTDAKGCTQAQSKTVTQPVVLAFSSTIQNATCKGSNNGAITIASTGGTPAYSYLWNTGATSQNISTLAAGTYTLTVQDVNNCKATNTIAVTEPSLLQASISDQYNVTCFGLSNGRIKVSPSGGTSSYSYLWSTGATTDSITGISSGNYIVTITDANGCTLQKSTNVTQPSAAITAATAITEVNCFGNSTGGVNVVPSGGTAPYSYLWSNNNTTNSINGMISGTYTVTVSDINGCSEIRSATIQQPAAALNTTTSTTNVLCFGNSTGVINIAPVGGTSPYNYVWSNGATSQDLNAIAQGSYTVTVTDSKGCTIIKSAAISQPSAGISQTGAVNDVKCFSSLTGSVTLSVSGGTSPYIYQWSNGTAGTTINNVASGTYAVTVTDANNCSSTSSYTVKQPGATLTMNTGSTNDVNCFGTSTGSASVTVTGGTSPYTYLWNNGASTANNNNLPAGSYSITVSDANNCTISSASINIGSPLTTLTATISKTDVKCKDGSDGTAAVTVSGGTAPYQYLWNNNATSAAISNLSEGTYTVTVTDAKSCTTTINISIVEPTATLTANTTKTDINCIGNTIGSIDLSVNGGTPGYNYNWSNGSTLQDITNLTTGTFTVTITDNNGCTISTNATITQPAGALSLTSNITQVKCFGSSTGSINITASAGTPPYSYSWSNGSTDQALMNQPAGSYTLTLTDANACVLTNTIFITQPLNPISVTAVNQDAKCNGDPSGGINITVSGGTPTYTYLWNNNSTSKDLTNLAAGSYTVTITDINACKTTSNFAINQPSASLSATVATMNLNCHNVNDGALNLTVSGGTSPYSFMWSNGSNNEDLNMLSQGTYSVTITDVNGCIQNNSYPIVHNAAELTISSTDEQVKCFANNTGSIDITVNGGTSPYTYQWSNNTTTEDQQNLSNGTYQVTVSDANGCVENYTTSIQQPAAVLTVNAVKSDELCNKDKKGKIDLSVAGGTNPYSFLWSDGSSTEDLLGIEAGNYTVTVTDANGCSWTNSFKIDGPAAPLIFNVIADDPACKGSNTGSIIINPNGGTAPYLINWSNGAFTTSINDLSAGIYVVTVTDTNLCTTTQSITLSQPTDNVTATAQITNVDCFNNSSGAITILPTGGTSPYLYTWNDGTSSVTHGQLLQGTYYYTVTDAHNCTYTDSASIIQPIAALVLTGSSTNINCFNDQTGTITLNATGGTSPYQYLWSNGSTTANIGQAASGIYTVTVTDAHNCKTNSTHTISQPAAALALQTANTIDVKCHGELTGSISLNITGGTAPYSYNWFNGNTGSSINNISAGNYNVVITDNNGCSLSVNYTIIEPAASLSMTSAVSNVNCFGDNTGSINVNTAGGTSPYSYHWSNTTTNEDLLNSEAGTYTLTITDANQCKQIQTWTITQPSKALDNTFIVNDVKCFGKTSGSIQTLLTGGTGPFIYQWNSGQSTPALNNITGGLYILTVFDANGCKYTDSATVSEPSAALHSKALPRNLKCKNDQSGIINLTVTGGTPNYSFLWSNGATTQNINNLSAGYYYVTIKDVNNCSVKNSVQVSQSSEMLIVDPTVNNVSCYGLNNGTINLAISGGDPIYSVLWNTGATTTSIGNLVHGLYTATVVDESGCTIIKDINLQQPNEELALTVNSSPASCLLGTTGIINTLAVGGNPPYQYLWSNANTAQSITQLNPGTYTITITDLHGCSVTKTSTIIDESSLEISANGPPEICIGTMITLSAPAIPGVQYQWSYNNIPLNGATSNSFSTPVAGAYLLTATNNCGKYNSNPIQITTRTLQNVSVSNNFIICAGERAQLIASGGSKYSWEPITALNNPNVFNPVASPVSTTNYTVTITDNHGCKANATVQVAVMCDTLNVPNGFSPNGDGTNDYFEIDGLSLYPENTLFVYNRWGNLIYKKQEYDNKWDGKSNVNGIYFGRTLPNGTYYYILDLKNDEKPLNGFVVIRR